MKPFLTISALFVLAASGCDAFIPDVGGDGQACSGEGTCKEGLHCTSTGVCCRNHWEGPNCGTCPPHWDGDQDCNTCAGNWDISQDCDACLGNWDPAQGCNVCRPHWQDNDDDCATCEDNWDIAQSCTGCVGNWDPAQDCSACLNHWEDNSDDCGTCPGNWDAAQDCNGCVGNWDPAQDCSACLNHWEDNSDDCGTCPGNWDAAQDCAECLGNWDKLQDCTVCEGNWEDNGDNCGSCPGNWDAAQDCAECLGNWDKTQDCAVCRGNWVDNNDDCGTCTGNWDPTADCAACLNHWVDSGDDCGTCPPNWDAGQECDACLAGWAGDWCEKVTSCTGQPDFTLCEADTAPNDYYYDICVQENCESPGCGQQSCNAPGPHFTLADSGLRQCYNETGEIGCPGTAGAGACQDTPYCGQDFQYGWDVTNPATNRFNRSEETPGQPIVADRVTELVWQGCADNRNETNCLGGTPEGRTWRQALEYCDGLDWAGFTDWHLPDVYELLSIVDYNRPGGQAIDSGAFPQTASEHFWTSSTAHGDPASAMAIEFGAGGMEVGNKNGEYHFRCVRNGPLVAGGAVGPRYTVDNTTVPGEPVVTDNVTGLDWQGCLDGRSDGSCSTGNIDEYTWPLAVSRCQELSWGGHDDWYLPNIKQLHSMIDNRGGDPSVDPAIFPGSVSQVVWSSTSIAGEPTKAWVVHFMNGRVEGGIDNHKNDSRAIRCVREGS